MRATNLLLLVMDAVSVLQQQDKPVTADSIAKKVNVEWDLAAYLDEVCKEGLIAPVAGMDQIVGHYELTDRGRVFCKIASGCVDIEKLKIVCRNRSLLSRLSALELLMVIKKLRQNGQEVWHYMLAKRENENENFIGRLLRRLKDRALVTSRLETEAEAFAHGTNPRRLYDLTDAGRKLLEPFM